MATKTWWHGQRHSPARMGEASWHARLPYMSMLEIITEGKAYSRKSQESQRSCAILPEPSPRTKLKCWHMPSVFNILRAVLLVMFLPIRFSTAAFINFDNCLSRDIVNSPNPKLLQFEPLFVWAAFNSSAGSYNLNVTAYGNVAGIATKQPYPDETDPQWKNASETVGKIPDVYGSGPNALYTTFTTQFNVLAYTPYAPDAARFCNTSSLTACPVAPVFDFTGNQ